MEREYIGVDLHKGFFQACAVDPSGIRQWEGRFPRTAASLRRIPGGCDPRVCVSRLRIDAHGSDRLIKTRQAQSRQKNEHLKNIEDVRQLGAFQGPCRSAASRASASERSQRTFITMKVRSSYCSASRIQSFISSESRALISLAGR
jgi:hypothetical protein